MRIAVKKSVAIEMATPAELQSMHAQAVEDVIKASEAAHALIGEPGFMPALLWMRRCIDVFEELAFRMKRAQVDVELCVTVRPSCHAAVMDFEDEGQWINR